MEKYPYEPIDLKALQCFAAMVRHGSITKASIEIGISDAAVSQRIRKLEKHLGKKLYEARGGKVRLTESGRRAAKMASTIFDQLEDLENEVREKEISGSIVLGTSARVVRHQLSDVVHSFRDSYRNAKLRLLSRGITETIGLVRTNEFDLGIIPFSEALPSDLVFHEWRTFRAFVLMSKNHPLACSKIPNLTELLTPETLSQHSQVIPEADSDVNQRVRAKLEHLGLPYNVSLEVSDLDNVKHYASEGHGLAVVNGVCITTKDIKLFHLIEIPEEFEKGVTYGVIIRKDKYISSALREMLELLNVPDGKF
jgi:molybdate transport repressor ModE-like protein